MTGNDIKDLLLAVADTMDANRDALCALDGEIGDADHGIAMAGGFGAVRKDLTAMDSGTPTEFFNTAAKSFLNAVGASSGPLYATAFMRAGAALKGKDILDTADLAQMISAMTDGIAHRGKAELGDKTMLDAWEPAARAALDAADTDAASILAIAASAAEAGAECTAAMQAKLGRAARLGERSIGHKDPGAASAALMLRAMANRVAQG